MPMREGIVTMCVGMHDDAGQVKKCVSCRGENVEMFKKNVSTESRLRLVTTLGVTIGFHAFRGQFVTYS